LLIFLKGSLKLDIVENFNNVRTTPIINFLIKKTKKYPKNGAVLYEISVGVAQLIYELWGNKDEVASSINADDIILLRNNMAQVAIDAKIPNKTPIELREDTEEDWARFIKEMKRKKYNS